MGIPTTIIIFGGSSPATVIMEQRIATCWLLFPDTVVVDGDSSLSLRIDWAVGPNIVFHNFCIHVANLIVLPDED